MADRLRELRVSTRIEIVPTGVDLVRFGAGRRDEALRLRLGVRQGERLLLSVCRLAKEKNVELILEALAFAQDASLKLAIAGDGPLRSDLEELARKLGIAEQTRFLGVVPRDDLPNFYASADAFVMPSTTETQGLVIAEALAAGAYVIAADAPQNRDVLGGAGLVVPPTPEAFAGAFGDLTARPAEAARAREAAEGFSLEVQIDRILGLYEILLRRVRIA